MRIIISGGGTGGHIFPALAIANAIKARHPEAEILFVGAKGRMEMEKVPAAGYAIKGLPIAGLQRQITLHNILLNLLLPFKVLSSRCKVRSILRSFKPDVVVGVGGFASQPTLSVAARMGYTTLLQEQNSYAGLANKTLARNAARICVAYPDMERFFPADKIVFTGNPVRQDIENLGVDRAQGCSHFGLDPERPVILVVGGSLGARSINCMMMDGLGLFPQSQVQVIWQTGRLMQQQAREAVASAHVEQWVKVHPFISRMDMAYAAADLVISRAGAIAISELTLVAKPVILVPSPNVAEDHQTHNAMALVNRQAAVLVRDAEAADQLIPTALTLIRDKAQLESLHTNVLQLAQTDSARRIAEEVIRLAK
jgi:UDP-N-acetylglucosamine--N-acetylmuramyl-(pentapeptide) pyrophosphoryl-undecaprenol N-acetylglucosamine transferase